MGLDGFEVRIEVDGVVIGVPLLFTMFTCLRRCGKEYLKKNLKLAEEDKVMTLKYELTEKSRKKNLRLFMKDVCGQILLIHTSSNSDHSVLA